jgi:hydrogenase maturation factor HypE
LISCSLSNTNEIIGRLRKAGIRCTEIGRFQDLAKGRWLVSDGKREELKGKSVQDELWIALSKYGNLP